MSGVGLKQLGLSLMPLRNHRFLLFHLRCSMPSEHKSHLPPFDNFAADVYIRISLEGNRYTAEIQFRGMRPQRIPIELTPNDLEELNAELQQAIEQVASNVETDGIYGDALS